MESCREVLPLLEWLAADELDKDGRLLAEAHLRECPRCRRELAAWRTLLAAAASPAAEAEREMTGIDWQAVSARVVAGVERRPRPRRLVLTAWPLPLAAAAAALVAVIGLGVFFLSRSGGIPRLTPFDEGLAASVSRLQSGLAREEAATYLQQSQLMLTGLLKNCASEEMAPWEMRLVSRQAKELLLKKKYFQPHLSELEWSKVRQVSERIDWLSYEILQLEERQLCDQVSRLQGIMERERLLLKIRLVESEFSRQPIQEA